MAGTSIDGRHVSAECLAAVFANTTRLMNDRALKPRVKRGHYQPHTMQEGESRGYFTEFRIGDLKLPDGSTAAAIFGSGEMDQELNDQVQEKKFLGVSADLGDENWISLVNENGYEWWSKHRSKYWYIEGASFLGNSQEAFPELLSGQFAALEARRGWKFERFNSTNAIFFSIANIADPTGTASKGSKLMKFSNTRAERRKISRALEALFRTVSAPGTKFDVATVMADLEAIRVAADSIEAYIKEIGDKVPTEAEPEESDMPTEPEVAAGDEEYEEEYSVLHKRIATLEQESFRREKQRLDDAYAGLFASGYVNNTDVMMKDFTKLAGQMGLDFAVDHYTAKGQASRQGPPDNRAPNIFNVKHGKYTVDAALAKRMGLSAAEIASTQAAVDEPDTVARLQELGIR